MLILLYIIDVHALFVFVNVLVWSADIEFSVIFIIHHNYYDYYYYYWYYVDCITLHDICFYVLFSFKRSVFIPKQRFYSSVVTVHCRYK